MNLQHFPTLTLILLTLAQSSARVVAEDFAATLKPLIADNAELQLLTNECKFTEGPAADASGKVYFTDQPNDRIMTIDVDGKISEFMSPAGRCNGLYFDRAGDLYGCADDKNEIWKIKKDGSHSVVFKSTDNKPLNGPNDLWISDKNYIYFSDPFYARPWWNDKRSPREVRGVMRVKLDGSDPQVVDDTLRQPNGIVGDPNANMLYVADIDSSKIYAYPLQSDGNLGERKLFCEEPSDGMTVDNKGNVYLTNKTGVAVYARDGKKLGVIPTGRNWTANVCFGGADNSTLFITASESVFSLKMSVQGAAQKSASKDDNAWKQDPLIDRYEAKTFSDSEGTELLYRQYAPESPTAAEKLPLLIFLHGAGERGDDNLAQLKHGALKFITDTFQQQHPCFVIAPQCPKNHRWGSADWYDDTLTQPAEPTAELKAVRELIDAAVKQYPIDTDRIYITGLSMGGYGTWDALARYPNLFAAAVPICGGGDIQTAKNFASVPIWCFHGGADPVVPVGLSRGMIEALKSAGGSPKYTEYPGVKHDSWTQAYETTALYTWLFAQ